MTQENKELLLKDLCTRLPYGVIVATPKGNGYLCSINQTIFGNEYGINIKATQRDYFNDRECDIKPYLRPMSSMTEEEKHQWIRVLKDPEYSCSGDDWLIEHHFDIRHLIEEGLAIEVTEENNPYKE